MRFARHPPLPAPGGFTEYALRQLAARNVNRITQAEAVLTDTLSNTEAMSLPQLETAKMFTANTFESNLTKFVAAVTLAAFILSLVA